MIEKKIKASDLWLLFGFSLFMHLVFSAVTVIPNSPAQVVNNILFAGSAFAALVSFIAAIYFSWFRKKNEKMNRDED